MAPATVPSPPLSPRSARSSAAPIEVLSLSLRSLTPGRDSVGQVFLQAKVDGKSLSGNGASTDIVEASARALVHALNKAHHAEQLEATSPQLRRTCGGCERVEGERRTRLTQAAS